MPYTYFSGTASISNTEHSLSTNTSGPDFNNASGVYQLFLNCSGMLVGDEYRMRLYERASNEAADLSLPVFDAVLNGPVSPPIYATPALILGNFWEMTLLGSGVPSRTFYWSIRQG